jgi:hypothetical protein
MKKITLLFALLFPVLLFSQVERERVVVELATGTW